jgi:hypothetical protein
MLMRFRRARTVTISGFSADAVPGSATEAQVSLDDWVADQAAAQPTRGHVLRLRFLTVAGAEVFGGSVDLTVWGNTTGGFWVADAARTACNSSGRYVSNLTGGLFVQVASIGITDIPTAVTMEIWVQEAGLSVT